MSSWRIAMLAVLIGAVIITVVLFIVKRFFSKRVRHVLYVAAGCITLLAAIGAVALLVRDVGIHDGVVVGETIVNMRSSYYLLACSAACGVIGLCILTNLIKLNQRYKIGGLTLTALLTVLFLQMSVVIGYPYADGTQLSSGGHYLANILQYTLQYFSLDAGYANIVESGQKVFGDTGIIHLFHIIAGSMTVLAPLVGGFAIFDILGRFFPKIRLFFNRKTVKYVFSELNQYSVETAESIYRLREQLLSDKKKREEYKQKHGKTEYYEIVDSVIIFTDVYINKGSEEDKSELLKRAKDIDAICLKDDVLNLNIFWAFANLKIVLFNIFNFIRRKRPNNYINRKTVYFLVDGNDFDVKQGVENNLQTAVSLYSTSSDKTVWTKTEWFQLWTKAHSMEMYVFTRNENADRIIGAARAEWEKNFLLGKKKTGDLVEFYDTALLKLEKVEAQVQKAQLQEVQIQGAQDNRSDAKKDVFEVFNKLYNEFIKSIDNIKKTPQPVTVADYLNRLKKLAENCKSGKSKRDEAEEAGEADKPKQEMTEGAKNDGKPTQEEEAKDSKSKTEIMRMFAELCNAFVKAINAKNKKGQAVDVSFDSEIDLLNALDKKINKLVRNAFKQIKAARILTANVNANNEFTQSINDFKYFKSNKNKKDAKENKKKIKEYLCRKARCETNIYDAVKCVNKELHDAVNPNINVWNKKRVSSVFKCINEYRNLVYNLLDGDREKDECGARSVPLYTALKTGQGYDTGKLNVLIVGSGRIAKEFLKATYWCGQMLDNGQNFDNRQTQGGEKARESEKMIENAQPFDIEPAQGNVQDICPTKLRIGVLSLDADRSRQQFEFDMPEVFAPERCNYKKNKNSYCEFRFVEEEFGTKLFKSKFDEFINGEIWKHELDPNGGDVGSESVAEKKPVKKFKSTAATESAVEKTETTAAAPAAKSSGKTEAVRNSEVDVDYVLVALGSDEVNMRAAEWISREISRKKAKKNIPVNYVIENGELCDSLRESAAGAINASGVLLNPFGSLRDRFEYGNIRMSDAERRALIANCAYGNDGGKEEFMLDSYSRGSSIAVAIHNSYKNTCISPNGADNEKRAVWLEHRRWNAYMRSEGYRCHTAREFDEFALKRDAAGEITGLAQKNVDLKLHACLVEAEPSEIKGKDTTIEAVSKTIEAVLETDKDSIKNIITQHQSDKDISNILKEIRQKVQATDGFDDLDTLSAIKNAFKENGEERTSNYKNNDISIYKNLDKDRHDKIILTLLETYYKTHELNDIQKDMRSEIKQVKEIFEGCAFYDKHKSNRVFTNKCVYNSNIIIIEDKERDYKDLFIWLCEWREYDIVAAFVNDSLEDALKAGGAEILDGKKPFIVDFTSANGNQSADKQQLLIGIPRGVSADVQLGMKNGNDNKYYIFVEENEGYQKNLGIYADGCLVDKKQKPWRVS